MMSARAVLWDWDSGRCRPRSTAHQLPVLNSIILLLGLGGLGPSVPQRPFGRRVGPE